MPTLIAKQSIFIKATQSAVWDFIYQMDRWHDWDESIRSVQLLESPKAGAKGKFFLRSGPATMFTIIGLETRKLFQLAAPLLWTTLLRDYRVIETPEGTVATFEASCVGPMEKTVSRFYRRRFARSLSASMTRFKSAVEERERAKVVSDVRRIS